MCIFGRPTGSRRKQLHPRPPVCLGLIMVALLASQPRVLCLDRLHTEGPEVAKFTMELLEDANQTSGEAAGLLATAFDEERPESLDTSDEAGPGARSRQVSRLVEEELRENEEFYTRNPVDQREPASNSTPWLEAPAKEEEEEEDDDDEKVDLGDFYDRAYSSFFENRTVPAASSGKKEKKAAAAAASRPRRLVDLGCAVLLARGNCITYHMIEAALGAARKLLSYRRPSGLESPEPSERTINAVGELVEYATRVLAYQLQLTPEEVNFELEAVDMRRTSLWAECPLIFRQPPTCQLSRYRTHTGRCNNPLGTHLGSTSMPFVRILPAAYSDGIGLPRLFSSQSGAPLPPVRLISLHLHPNLEVASDDNSALFASWGQLLNHDLAAASGARPDTGHHKPCCFKGRPQAQLNRLISRSARDRVCMPIEIGPLDPVYAPYRITCHEFKRSLAGLRPGCTLGPRVNINTITSYIDASFVYGSSYSTSQQLRGPRGTLATWNYFRRWRPPLKPLLPPQLEQPDEECVNRRGRSCFRSGDARTNQQIQLTVLHTLHTRQHNRLARALAFLNPHWSGDRVYHEARHIHVAMVQHLVLSEYLPTLLGAHLCHLYNLTEPASELEHWDHYDPSVNPGIRQGFAAAAFRQGHSSVSGLVFRFNNLHAPTRLYRMRQLFRQPWPLFEPWAMDEFLLGLVDAPAQQVDQFLSADLAGHLMQMPGEPVGLDLAAINLQRGRDQALPSYLEYREWCGLEPVDTFEELASYMPNGSAQTMAALYESPADIDLFAGGLSEYPVEGSQLGPTFACIVGRQFQAARVSDRLWFESSLGPHAFTPAQLASIRQVSLARIICANSDNLLTVQQWALKLAHPVLNPRLACAQLPDLDITLWLDPLNRTPNNIDNFN